MATIEAYPLTWPDGWRRTSAELRTRAKFRSSNGEYRDGAYCAPSSVSVADATSRLKRELGLMSVGDWQVVISTNIELRRDGYPRSDRRAPADPGAAVYWQHGKIRRCIAVDRYDRVADNLAAIAATLEAMRAIERHGGAQILERAFTGFTALPAPEQWWQVLGVTSRATRAEIDDAYRKLAFKHHPDRGGDSGDMARINAARDQSYEV